MKILQAIMAVFLETAGIHQKNPQLKENEGVPEKTVNPSDERKLEMPVNSLLEMAQFVEEHVDSLSNYFFKRLEKGIRNDEDIIFLFRAGEITATYSREEYSEILIQLEQFYIKRQQYEKIKNCHTLADLHKINTIIRLSKKK